MPIILKPGDKRRGYEIVRELNRGAFAIAYEAVSPAGKRVFFKQYKSPTRLVDWYSGFVSHQKELKRRIGEDAAARDKCYRFLEFFEERDFFQVFEYIEGGKTLADCVISLEDFSWSQIVVFAKVMLLGIKSLHGIGIIHTDLKPDNVILIPDEDIKGYRLRIVDLDWAIFSDKQAPWHGRQGYIGTPGYRSPEHLGGITPTSASDMFTCGIMLSQILTGQHPFAEHFADEDAYRVAVLAGRYQPAVLLDTIDKADKAHVEAMINACLSPEPSKRPTANALYDALTGKTRSKEPVKPSPPPLKTGGKQNIGIHFNGKLLTTVSVDSDFGKVNFKSVDPDAQFLSNPQFRLTRCSSGWAIEHSSTATNETIVDGRKLTGSIPVKNNMCVSVGNSAKGIEKFSLMLTINT